MHSILIDCNNWGFAGMANPKLSAGTKDTQSIFSVIKKVQNAVIDYPNAQIIILWDGKSWRKEVYTEYKANRETTEKAVEQRKEYFLQKQEIMRGLELLGVRQIWGSNMEADDMAQILSVGLTTKGGTVTLLTADQDWQQLVNEQVRWIDLIHGKKCTYKSFQDITGFKDTQQFIEAKCVLGDAGDNIKGIKGIGPKTLDSIYKLHSSFASFISYLSFNRSEVKFSWESLHKKKFPKVLWELYPTGTLKKLDENLIMVDLATPHRPKVDKIIDKKGKFDRDGFEAFCHEHAFFSILKRYDDFLKPFEENPYINK